MSYEIVPSVQACLDVFPTRKDNFDRVMEVANLIFGNTVGTICSTASGLFQTYALIQGRKEARKIVAYTCNLEEARMRTAVELRRLELEAQRETHNYNLQKQVLTLYVDSQYQHTVDQMTRSFNEASNRTERMRYDAIREIDRYTKSVMKGMDRRYQELLRQEELLCAAYRDQLFEMKQNGISRNQVAFEICQCAIRNSSQLSDNKFQMVLNTVSKMTEPKFYSFEKFVEMSSDIQKRRLFE